MSPWNSSLCGKRKLGAKAHTYWWLNQLMKSKSICTARRVTRTWTQSTMSHDSEPENLTFGKPEDKLCPVTVLIKIQNCHWFASRLIQWSYKIMKVPSSPKKLDNKIFGSCKKGPHHPPLTPCSCCCCWACREICSLSCVKASDHGVHDNLLAHKGFLIYTTYHVELKICKENIKESISGSWKIYLHESSGSTSLTWM